MVHKRSVEALPDQCTQRYGCLNSTWARICAPTSDDTLVEVSRSPCPKERPSCDYKTGACVIDTISTEFMKPSNLTCFNKEGYFPHPTDCKKFFVCSNYTSYLFECAETNTYNIYSHRCDGSRYACYTIDCANTINDGKKVQHPQSNVFFAYCSGGTPIGMDRCLGADVLNATSQLCEPNCSNEGLIRDNLDCTKYYKCSFEWISNNRFMIRRHDQCEDGHSFKPEAFQCVPGIPQTGCIQKG